MIVSVVVMPVKRLFTTAAGVAKSSFNDESISDRFSERNAGCVLLGTLPFYLRIVSVPLGMPGLIISVVSTCYMVGTSLLPRL